MSLIISGNTLLGNPGFSGPVALTDLTDVNISNLQDKQYLRFNASANKWQNAFITNDVYNYFSTSVSGINGITVTPVSNDIVDISLSPSGVTAGTYTAYTADTYGRIVTGRNLVVTGDVSGTASGLSVNVSLSVVNSNIGTFGSSTQVPVITVDGKGRITGVSTANINGTATVASNLAGGSAGSLPYQAAANTTAMLSIGSSSQVLTGGTLPNWSNTPALTGTNFTGIPNTALVSPSFALGSTNVTLGTTVLNVTGLSALSATSLVGALTGNATTATTLATARSISTSGDATWTVNFDGSANVTAAITLATVNGSPTSSSFHKITTNGKGLVTSSTPVITSDITGVLGYTPLNKGGDTTTGFLILNGDPVSALGAATKQYVDTAISTGLRVHSSVQAASTANLTATYSNGTSGVGATLTNSGTQAAFVLDTYTGVVNDRFLIKDQTNAKQNGIYVLTNAGSGSTNWVLTRASDADNSTPASFGPGVYVFVCAGSANLKTGWSEFAVGTGSSNSIVIGTDNITFTQFSAAGTYSAGTGLLLSGTVFSNTGVLSLIAGSNIGINSSTGNITVSVTGTVPLATSATTATTLATARSISTSGDATWTVNFDGSANVTAATTLATVNSNVGSFGNSTNVPVITVDGKGRITGVSTVAISTAAQTAVNLIGGAPGSLPYQSAMNTTAMLSIGSASQVLTGGTLPNWSNTPTLTGTNFTGIPNSALINSSFTLGSTSVSLGNTITTISGLSAVGATTFVGSLSGNATTSNTLATARSISTSGDATWTVNFDGSANVTAAITLATVNGSPTTAGFHKITTSSKGLVTSSTPVITSDITGVLGYTPANQAGDSFTGAVNFAGPVTVASAATTNIGAANSNDVNISGTTTITAFDTVVAGVTRTLKFAGVLTLTYNSTSLILPGASNITTANGDTAQFLSLGSGNWKCNWYTKSDGTSVVASLDNTKMPLAGGSFTGAVNFAGPVTVASAATTNIGAANSNDVNISGTTTITAFDTVAVGVLRVLHFSTALTLTHNSTSLILPGASNITTANGDNAAFVSLGSGNWKCNWYTKANGQAVSTSGGTVSSVSVVAANGFTGSVATSTTTPAITISTTASGVLKGSSGNLTAATAGTDYSVPTGVETLTNKTLTNPTITNYTESVFTSSGTTFTINLANGTIQQFSTTGNSTITIPLPVAGKSYTILVSYGGSHSITWSTGGGGTLKWPSGVAPTTTSASGKSDIFTFFSVDSSVTYGTSGGFNL